MLAIPPLVLLGLLATEPHAEQEPVAREDRVEVVAAEGTIRGRVADLGADAIVVNTRGGARAIPVTSIWRIHRVGDSLVNGAAIGAGIGGGAALGLMAKLCANSNCSDMSANLDPRFALMGSLVGAGIGTLVDALIERRTPLSHGGADQRQGPAPASAMSPPARRDVMMFARAGGAHLTDDEGSLGSGGTWGGGIRVPLGRRLALQAAYDRQTRRRDFEFGRSFSGTERLFTGKLFWSFRTDTRVMPYAGIGLGILDSRSRSDAPTLTLTQGNIVVAGPVETLRTQSRSTVLGFATGVEVRLFDHLALVADLTLDMGGRQAFGSTRLTLGAGWGF